MGDWAAEKGLLWLKDRGPFGPRETDDAGLTVGAAHHQLKDRGPHGPRETFLDLISRVSPVAVERQGAVRPPGDEHRPFDGAVDLVVERQGAERPPGDSSGGSKWVRR